MADRMQKNTDGTLSDMQKNETRTVGHVAGDDAFARRLYSMGFTPDTPVTCVAVSPIGGIKAYRVAGTIVALRTADAGRVRIR